MRHTSLPRLVAAVVMTAAAGSGALLMAGAGPAAAATCADANGVSVVVDFKQLGGGVRSTCVADGAGQRASALFPAAGFDLDYVQNEPGFVCRVDQRPAPQTEPCVDTPPATAYWGLWWSDGKSGSWSYSNYGVSSLKVPAGGYVALAWKQGDGSPTAPGTPATAHSSSPAPSNPPSTSPSQSTGSGSDGSGGGAGQTKPPKGQGGQQSKPPKTPTQTPTTAPTTLPSEGATASPVPGVTESPSRSPKAGASADDEASAENSPTADATASDGASEPGDAGTASSEAVPVTSAATMPTWVPAGIIGLLITIAAITAVRRRARQTS